MNFRTFRTTAKAYAATKHDAERFRCHGTNCASLSVVSARYNIVVNSSTQPIKATWAINVGDKFAEIVQARRMMYSIQYLLPYSGDEDGLPYCEAFCRVVFIIFVPHSDIIVHINFSNCWMKLFL